ncbi:MAG TPA: RNA polymerase sigma factor [Dehalococcoidia bacterium]|nr:RNA polymerase sigma factor [Dehalococcoidia bacterium]
MVATQANTVRDRTGSAPAFTAIFERHYGDILRYALVITNDPAYAEDIAADTFARAWQAWRAGREPDGPPLPWLLTIARNLATDRWRRARRTATRRLGSGEFDPIREIESIDWLRSLSRVLSVRQREVVVLRYYRDLNDAAIGRVMGLSESGVRSLVARALVALKAHPEIWQ